MSDTTRKDVEAWTFMVPAAVYEIQVISALNDMLFHRGLDLEEVRRVLDWAESKLHSLERCLSAAGDY